VQLGHPNPRLDVGRIQRDHRWDAGERQRPGHETREQDHRADQLDPARAVGPVPIEKGFLVGHSLVLY
jgi:hypothetical protein